MGDKKGPENLAQGMESFEVTELDDRDLDAAAGGGVVAVGEDGTNGNCSICKPGDPVPDGTWTNGNCSS